jgi:FkbM family methyltransferase
MTDPSGAPPIRLFTTWGTVLYVDVTSGQLRHGPVDRSPANVRFASNGADGRIMYEMAGSLRPTECLADHCRAIDRVGNGDGTATPTVFEAVALREQWIGLKADGLFLCAEPDGRVTLSRQVCSAWESFLPSGPDLSPQEHSRGSQFARRRVIVMRHRGNLANKMFQYMGALTLASRIKDCTIVNVSIPEWGIDIPDDTQHEFFFDNADMWTWDPFRPHVEELCAMANQSQSIRIMMADHLQRMEFLMPPQSYNDIFPKDAHLAHEMTEEDLLINIRTGDILDGIPQHYPLLPISFYEDVVARTGLKPLFVGQLGDSEYVRQLKQRFSGAQFIDSQGARADFDLIRSAKNIVVAVSTFSWVAAWLSQAETIILPLSGFYNPAHHRELDLLPADDIRYRFFLFPLNFGLPEKEALQHHERMRGYWKEISRSQVALLKNAAPFLRVPRQNYDSGLPMRVAHGATITFDPVWYAHRYLDAAMEISEGWFEDPLHHYLEVGRLRGYLPTRPVQDEISVDLSLPNLALNNRVTQSSLSQWSKGATVEEDAGYAVSGDPSQDGFHTNNDPRPWWMVDLGSTAQLHFIRIFNRERIPEWIQQRANPLVVELSNDGEQWATLFRTNRGQVFGGHSGGHPLVWSTKQPVEARFVRVSIPRQEYLHLAEVEIYGKFSAEQTGLTEAARSQDDPTIEAGLARVDAVLAQYRNQVLSEQGTGRFTDTGTSYESLLDLLAQMVPDPIFLEIGAMDGRSLDPLYATARKFGWRGMLVEPLKDLFERLKKNYENDPKLIFENVAISDTHETRTLYRVPLAIVDAGGVPNWAAAIATFYPDRNAVGGVRTPAEDYDRIRPFIRQETVQCIPLQVLLDRHAINRIDLIQIDTEGHDYHILKQLDLGKYRPYIIRFEAYHLPTEELDESIRNLVAYGYECCREDGDVIATRRQALETASKKTKSVTRVLFFAGTGWAFGSVHFELVKYLHSRGLVGDVLDFGRSYNREEMAMIGDYYDCVVGIVGETWPLTDNYGIPHEKIVAIAHGEYDLQHALETRAPEEFDRFAGYGVISEWLLQLSADLGIRRVPKIVKYGVNYQRFLTPISRELKVVGYGGSMHREDREGVDWKRGGLAREATEATGLVFTPAGQFHFLAMPGYYQQVDAVLVTSLREGFGLPAMEAAAAGRLVISTPVGGFPDQASLGAGITAPFAADQYKEFVIDRLQYYKDHPMEYVEMCNQIQEASKYLDWEYTIDEWIELIKSAKGQAGSPAETAPA